jgi:hypothetical protein
MQSAKFSFVVANSLALARLHRYAKHCGQE